jgi:hypothetical protein
MHGDFSRVTFDPSRHFSRVLTQQGRVSVDAEPNEQAAILLHYVRRLIADLVGEHGVPNPDGLGGKGFSISLTQGGKDFDIGWGRYYVDGVLVENESLDVTYFKQPDYFPDPSSNPFSANFLAYLDVWERHVTFRDRPDLLEVALGDQIDPCSRAQVVWQVKLTIQPDANGPTSQELGVVRTARGARPSCAPSAPGPVATTPCEAPSAGYRGAENQLYRVEVHNSGTAGQGATFKWSRDNGAVSSVWSRFRAAAILGTQVETPHGPSTRTTSSIAVRQTGPARTTGIPVQVKGPSRSAQSDWSQSMADRALSWRTTARRGWATRFCGAGLRGPSGGQRGDPLAESTTPTWGGLKSRMQCRCNSFRSIRRWAQPATTPATTG